MFAVLTQLLICQNHGRKQFTSERPWRNIMQSKFLTFKCHVRDLCLHAFTPRLRYDTCCWTIACVDSSSTFAKINKKSNRSDRSKWWKHFEIYGSSITLHSVAVTRDRFKYLISSAYFRKERLLWCGSTLERKRKILKMKPN